MAPGKANALEAVNVLVGEYSSLDKPPRQLLDPENLWVVHDWATLGFDLLADTRGEIYWQHRSIYPFLTGQTAEEKQRKLMMLVQAFANTGNPLDNNFIRHQHIEHNFDSCLDILEELEADLKCLKEVRAKARKVTMELKALYTAVSQGEYNEGLFPSPPELWPLQS